MSGPAISAAAMCAERSAYRPDAVMVSRLAGGPPELHCGHSLDAVFRLTADRSNPLVALKRSTRIVDRLESHDHEDLAAARAFHGCHRKGSDRTGRTMRPRTRRHGRNHPGLRPV